MRRRRGGQRGSKTVRVTLANHVWTENIKKALPEFEKETGLKVELTQLGEDQLSDQYNVKLNAGTSELDVMMYRPLQEGKQFAKNGYLADLTDKVKSNKEWDWSDFQPGPVQATTYEEKVVGVPLITEQEVLYYRKDLLEKAGYTNPPKTLDELKEMAAKIQSPTRVSPASWPAPASRRPSRSSRASCTASAVTGWTRAARRP